MTQNYLFLLMFHVLMCVVTYHYGKWPAPPAHMRWYQLEVYSYTVQLIPRSRKTLSERPWRLQPTFHTDSCWITATLYYCEAHFFRLRTTHASYGTPVCPNAMTMTRFSLLLVPLWPISRMGEHRQIINHLELRLKVVDFLSVSERSCTKVP